MTGEGRPPLALTFSRLARTQAARRSIATTHPSREISSWHLTHFRLFLSLSSSSYLTGIVRPYLTRYL
jgi:hypothetical protein